MRPTWFKIYWPIWVMTALILVGCGLPLPLPSFSQPTAPATPPTPVEEDLLANGGAMATVSTRSLRVRALPSVNSEVIAGIAEGESYRVLALSEDGLWVQLAIEAALEGAGWVSTNLVSVEGDITNLAGAAEETVSEAVRPSLTLIPTPAAGLAVVNTDGSRLRVRSGPSTTNPIIGYIYDGETYEVLETNQDGSWLRIPPTTGNNTENTRGGWVSAEFMVIGE